MAARILTGGVVHTFAAAVPAEAIAIDGGRIVAVGAAGEVARLAGEGAEVTELAGRAVLPGFIDAHHHLGAAVLSRGAVDCSPAAAPTLDALGQAMRRGAAGLPAGAWVLGSGYDEWALGEGRAPTRAELDAACPEHPAFVTHFSFHQGVANSRALALAGIGRTTPHPPAGRIERGRRGEPTGRLFETASATVERMAAASLMARDGAGFAARLERYQEELFAVGITAVADPTVTVDAERRYREARALGGLRLAVLMMPTSEAGYLARPNDRLDGPPTGEGDEQLRVGPLKLFFDGGDNCALCLTAGQAVAAGLAGMRRMLRLRTRAPLHLLSHMGARLGRDGRLHTGIRFYPTDAEAERMAARAVERGFALAVHAMGNEAVAQAVRALGAVRRTHRDAPPPRIEHAMYAEPADLRRAADLGLAVVVQPSFLRLPAMELLPAIPGLPALPFRAMREAGLPVAGSSDAPVAPFAPLAAARDAAARRTPGGHAVRPEQALTPMETLAAYTRGAALACGWLDSRGTLEPGKRADLVILSGDPAVSLDGVEVVETVCRGATVYRRPEAARRGSA